MSYSQLNGLVDVFTNNFCEMDIVQIETLWYIIKRIQLSVKLRDPLFLIAFQFKSCTWTILIMSVYTFIPNLFNNKIN